MNIKSLCQKYNHALFFLYALIYAPWFTYLEHHVTRNYYLIHSPIDDCIPFVEFFIVPYIAWFGFCVIGTFYLFFTDKKAFVKMAIFQIIGMTIFLTICTVFPNGLDLRPAVFEKENVFVDLVRMIYSNDTPTNVLPSMHVFNSLGLCVGYAHSDYMKSRVKTRYFVYGLSALIILSTMFVKQHSVTDVVAASLMSVILYTLVYVDDKKQAHKYLQQPI